MKLLVLGASSQLGQELTGLLCKQGIDHKALASSEVNLIKQMEVVKVLSQINADQVINVASYTNLEKAETDPEASKECDIINTQGVSTLAEVCDHLNVPLIHHSSSYVFDGIKSRPYDENDETNPVCRYGLSKWLGERTIRESLDHHVILRTDWMFSVYRNRLFKLHIEAVRKNKGETEVMDHRFSPTPASDVARVILAIAKQIDCNANVWGTYHYCALMPLSQEHFVEYFLKEAAKYDRKVAKIIDSLQLSIVPVRKPYIANTALSCQKILETFGIKQRSRNAGVIEVLENLYKRKDSPPGAGAAKPKKSAPGERAIIKTAPKKQPPHKKKLKSKTASSRAGNKKTAKAKAKTISKTAPGKTVNQPPARKAAKKKS